MSDDPIGDLAENQLAIMAADVAIQLERGTGTRPVLWLLVRARQRAAAAINQFMVIDAANVKDVRLLQEHINQFSNYIDDVRTLLTRGKEADIMISEEERREIEELVGSTDYLKED